MKSLSKSLLFNYNKSSFASKIKRSLPMPDKTLKQHDPELYKLVE